MTLHINDNRMLREIQLDFSRFYPYLRLEFYTHDKAAGSNIFNHTKIDPYVKLASIRNKHHAGALHIFDTTTIKELKQILRNEFQLYVQVCHYTQSGWITADDALEMSSLADINEHGRQKFHAVHNVSAQSKNLF
jgi:hypothetical protein